MEGTKLKLKHGVFGTKNYQRTSLCQVKINKWTGIASERGPDLTYPYTLVFPRAKLRVLPHPYCLKLSETYCLKKEPFILFVFKK